MGHHEAVPTRLHRPAIGPVDGDAIRDVVHVPIKGAIDHGGVHVGGIGVVGVGRRHGRIVPSNAIVTVDPRLQWEPS